MKKQTLALAVSAISVLPLAAQADGPIDGSLYGKALVTVDNVDSDSSSNDQWELNSNASRIGVEGKMHIHDSLYAIYKAEFEIQFDDGDKDNNKSTNDPFSQRNIIVGLQGDLGTIWAGRHDTPTKLAQNKIDQFNDLAGDLAFAFEGENRVSNIIAYTTPSMSGVSAMVAVIPGENKDDFDQNGEPDDGLADAVSYSISYENDTIYLALAGDKDLDKQDLMRAIGQFKLGDLMLGLMYQENESNLDSSSSGYFDESGYFVSASYKINSVTLKAQYGNVEDDASDNEYETWSVGADYKLGSNTKLLAYYTANTATDGVTSADDETDIFGVGIEQKF